MNELSLDRLRIEAERSVLPAAESSLLAMSDDVMSPDILDSLFWSVLVGFVVNVAAGLVTPLLAKKKNGILSPDDLTMIRKMFREETVQLKGAATRDDFRKAALAAIPESVHSGREEIAGAVADAAVAAMTKG